MITLGKLIDVYDGDTCDILILVPPKLICKCDSNLFIKYRCRIYGYDSPEIKPKLDTLNR